MEKPSERFGISTAGTRKVWIGILISTELHMGLQPNITLKSRTKRKHLRFGAKFRLGESR